MAEANGERRKRARVTVRANAIGEAPVLKQAATLLERYSLAPGCGTVVAAFAADTSALEGRSNVVFAKCVESLWGLCLAPCLCAMELAEFRLMREVLRATVHVVTEEGVFWLVDMDEVDLSRHGCSGVKVGDIPTHTGFMWRDVARIERRDVRVHSSCLLGQRAEVPAVWVEARLPDHRRSSSGSKGSGRSGSNAAELSDSAAAHRGGDALFVRDLDRVLRVLRAAWFEEGSVSLRTTSVATTENDHDLNLTLEDSFVTESPLAKA